MEDLRNVYDDNARAEGQAWISETTIAPWVIYVLGVDPSSPSGIRPV